MRAKRTRTATRAWSDPELTVRAALRRRGLRWDGERDPTPVLVPRVPRWRAHHYELLHHYSYRLFLRDVLKHPDTLSPATLGRYVSAAVAARYLRFLASAGLVARGRLRDR